MSLFALSTFNYILNGVLIALSLFLILVILVQRGKGGGLVGAFGGAGGSSAFGTRAGDTFTKITLYMALVWVLVIMIHVKVMNGDKPDTSKKPDDAGQVEGT